MNETTNKTTAIPALDWGLDEDLTYTEGALVETLRRIRRAETDPAARAEWLAWDELRFVAGTDGDERAGYCADGPRCGKLLAVAAHAAAEYVAARLAVAMSATDEEIKNTKGAS